MYNFNRETESHLFAVWSKFAHEVDGFEGLCHAVHAERNVLLAHYVSKMIQRKEKQNNGDLSRQYNGINQTRLSLGLIRLNTNKLEHLWTTQQ